MRNDYSVTLDFRITGRDGEPRGEINAELAMSRDEENRVVVFKDGVKGAGITVEQAVIEWLMKNYGP